MSFCPVSTFVQTGQCSNEGLSKGEVNKSQYSKQKLLYKQERLTYIFQAFDVGMSYIFSKAKSDQGALNDRIHPK